MKYEKPVTIICKGKEAPGYVVSNDGSSSCALSLGCCVKTLYNGG